MPGGRSRNMRPHDSKPITRIAYQPHRKAFNFAKHSPALVEEREIKGRHIAAGFVFLVRTDVTEEPRRKPAIDNGTFIKYREIKRARLSVALDQVQGRARGKIKQGRMKIVDRCIVRERFGQLQFGQRFVFPDVYCFQTTPPGTEIEKLLLFRPTRVIKAQHARLTPASDLTEGPIRGSSGLWCDPGCRRPCRCVRTHRPEACSIHFSARARIEN